MWEIKTDIHFHIVKYMFYICFFTIGTSI